MPLWHKVGQNSPVNEVLPSIGNTILIAGVIGAFMRFVSTTKFMRQEFANIMYSKDFLSKPKNFDWALNNLIEASVERYMPAIRRHLKIDHLKENLPQRPDLVYKTYHQNFDVTWASKPLGILELDETMDLSVETVRNHKGTIEYKYVAPDLGQGFEYKIEELTLSHTDMEGPAIDKTSEVKYQEKDGDIEITYVIEVSGDQEHIIHRRMKRYVKLDQEPYIIYSALRYQLKTTVSFNCEHDDIKGYFTSLGTDREFKTIGGKNKTNKFTELYQKLLMKGQGYTIYFCAAQPQTVEKTDADGHDSSLGSDAALDEAANQPSR
ncbi:hypothetical protein EB809_13605 [Marinobacter sp. R17]|nr:hypothetical protein EB809_13605 [Marinobacter sp. R17]